MIQLIVCLSMLIFLQEVTVTERQTQEWTRKSTGEDSVSLDLVSRRYAAEGKPDIWLVGVAHIAEQSFYDEVSNLLEDMDIVLYESVRPTGSRPPSGTTDKERISSTTISMEFIADIAKRCAEERGTIPECIEDLVTCAALIDSRLSSFVTDASIGAWGRPFAMNISEDKATISIWCFGSDGEIGGIGSAQDIVINRNIEISELSLESEEEKGLQAEMADVMGLVFQLEALAYESPQWFCSDLTMGEVEAKLEERGADPAILGAITGDAFSAKIASGMMKLLPMLDMLVGGGIQETARYLMIEILSMPDSDELLSGIEPELAHVIIVDRNTEVLGDISAMLEIVEDVSTIGVLYGAGHMKDLSQRLEAMFGYLPVEDKWIVTMRVNPQDSLLSESDMKRMKFMLQYQMNQASKNQASKKEETVNTDFNSN